MGSLYQLGVRAWTYTPTIVGHSSPVTTVSFGPLFPSAIMVRQEGVRRQGIWVTVNGQFRIAVAGTGLKAVQISLPTKALPFTVVQDVWGLANQADSGSPQIGAAGYFEALIGGAAAVLFWTQTQPTLRRLQFQFTYREG